MKDLTPAPHTPIQSTPLRFFVLMLSTGFGLGYAPWAPGTFGSLLGIPLGLYWLQFPPWMIVLSASALFFLGSWCAQKSSLHWGEWDSSKIVIDEVLGQALAIYGLRRILLTDPSALPFFIALSFLLFRLCDIVKPFPARTFDRQHSGWGVMADDVVAGLYAAFIVWGIARIWTNHPL